MLVNAQMAASAGNVAAVAALLNHGAAVGRKRGMDGKSALHIAAEEGHPKAGHDHCSWELTMGAGLGARPDCSQVDCLAISGTALVARMTVEHISLTVYSVCGEAACA
jgi:hypothetical protein